MFSPYTVGILGFCPRLRIVHCMTLVFIFVANFSLPDEEGTPFQEILYVELAKDEAKEVVDLYNKVSLYYFLCSQCCEPKIYYSGPASSSRKPYYAPAPYPAST